ncbi:MAG: helix-hairpin-helix domain-containing protein [Candidatus Hermodarchaeia archaeon]|jgi:competence protein ComEA
MSSIDFQTEKGKLDDLKLKAISGTEKKSRRELNIEEFLYSNRIPLSLLLVGVILIGFGVLYFKKDSISSSPKIEVLESVSEGQDASELVVEIAGAIEKPGVYKLVNNARVEDLLIAAGGVSAEANREWIEKMINRAAKLTDGQKLYIPRLNEQSAGVTAKKYEGDKVVLGGVGDSVGSLININTATQKELESLWGIGPVYAQNIIEQRPYSDVAELLSRKIIKSNVYERNKDRLTVY